MRNLALSGILWLSAALASQAASFYPVRLDDSEAVYLTRDRFPVSGDGKTDDSQAIQSAIDKVQEATGEGILFVPEGRYRVTRTIFVWPGIRVIGYGSARPTFVLADNTPGFQQGIGYMFFYAGLRPSSGPGGRAFPGFLFHLPPGPPGAVPPNPTIPDANPGTFYSAMSNIDFEIGSGNPRWSAFDFTLLSMAISLIWTSMSGLDLRRSTI